MQGNHIRIASIGILIGIMLLWGCPSWLHGGQWYISLAHHFFHANIFHLAVNCFSLWTLFRKDYVYRPPSIIVPFACATVSWFFSPADPVGISNFLFASLGCRTPSLKSSWWRQKNVIVFFATSLAMLAFPQVSAVTHIVSFLLGFACANLARHIKSLQDDIRRAG